MKNKISYCAFFLLFVFSFTSYAEIYPLKTPQSGGDLMCSGGQHVIGMHELCARTGCVIDALHCG